MNSKEVTIRRNIPSIGLTIAVGACIFYYLLIYIPAHEKKINLRSVRQLNTFSSNCIAAYEGYDQGVSSVKGSRDLVDSALITTDKPGANEIVVTHDTINILLPWSGIVSDKPARYMVSVDQLVRPLENFDEFDDVIIVNLGANAPGRGAVLDDSRLSLTFYSIHDSLLNSAVAIKKIKLSSETYYAFHKRLKLGDSDLAVVAFISKTTFDKHARQVAPSVIIFFLLGFLLLLLSWPVLKLLLVNEHERLTSRDIQLTNYAVILGAAFVAINLAGAYFFLTAGPTGTNQVLKSLTEEIKGKFEEDICKRDSLLRTPTLFPGKFSKQDFKTLFSYNEVFSVNPKNGKVTKLMAQTGNDTYDSFLTKHIDVNVKTRPYYLEMKRPAEMSAPITSERFIQSIKSRTSGKQECALSLVYQDGSHVEIRVLTSRLLSVMNPILPSNYGFAVFDRQGLVQFHSDGRKVINENFLQECGDDPKLRSFMDNGSKGLLNLSYGYDHYRAYFEPLNADWFIVTFYDKQQIGNIASSVISFSIASYLLVLLYIFLLHLLFRADTPRFRILRSKPFFYQWLNPTRISSEKLTFLWRFMLTVLALDVVWFLTGTSIVGTLLWSLLTITICYSVIYRLLRLPGTLKHTSYEFWCHVIIGMLLVLSVINQINIIINYLPLILILAVYLIAYWKASSFKSTQGALVTSQGGYKPYRLFLMGSLLVMSIVPSLIIFKDHLNHERIIRARKVAIEQHQRLHPPTLAGLVEYKEGEPYVNYDLLLNNLSIVSFNKKNSCPYFGESDSWFYDETINYFGKDEVDYRGLVVPTSALWQMAHDSKRVYVRARTTVLDEWTSIPVFGFPLSAALLPDLLVFVVIALMSIWAFWRVSFEIIRRVFYLPLFYRVPQRKDKIIVVPPVAPEKKGVIHPFPARTVSMHYERWVDSVVSFRRQVAKYENEVTCPDITTLDGIYDYRTAEYERYTLTMKNSFKDHFERVWTNLSDSERYFLYDLAEDGIVNQYDKKMMNRMCEKGFIRLLPLEISHPAISEFIVEAISQESLIKMETKARAEGRWSNFRVPFAIIIIATLGFLSMVEEGLFTKISALLASVAFILPTLLNLLSSLPKLLPGKSNGS